MIPSDKPPVSVSPGHNKSEVTCQFLPVQSALSDILQGLAMRINE